MDNFVSLGRAGEPLIFVSERELAERHRQEQARIQAEAEAEAEANAVADPGSGEVGETEALPALDDEFVERARAMTLRSAPSPEPEKNPPPSIPALPREKRAPEPPSNLNEVLQSDLSALCSEEIGWTWSDMTGAGVCAEDLLFNPAWHDELKAPVLSRLGVKWRDLADAGLTADMVTAARLPMDWWVLNLGADDMFFHALAFKHAHIERLEWEPSSFRALLGCDVWIGEGGFVELRPINIRPLII